VGFAAACGAAGPVTVASSFLQAPSAQTIAKVSATGATPWNTFLLADMNFPPLNHGMFDDSTQQQRTVVKPASFSAHFPMQNVEKM
jgi:hypothetical protein